MAKARKKRKSAKRVGAKGCGCGPSAKPARIKHPGGRHTMCRRESNGRFTKKAGC